jgi:hypothetical protein
MPSVDQITTAEQSEPTCIRQARKNVRLLQKWGRWAGPAYIVIGIGYWVIPYMFWLILYRLAIAPNLVGNPAVQQQIQQRNNPIMEGFGIGLLLGILGGLMLYKGLHDIQQGITMWRGDPTSQTLVKSHDAFLELIGKEDGQAPTSPNADLSQESQSTNQRSS